MDVAVYLGHVTGKKHKATISQSPTPFIPLSKPQVNPRLAPSI